MKEFYSAQNTDYLSSKEVHDGHVPKTLYYKFSFKWKQLLTYFEVLHYSVIFTQSQIKVLNLNGLVLY